MKKNANSLPLTCNRLESNEGTKKIVSYLQFWGRDSYFVDTNYDLLASAMTEFVASKSFSTLPEKRREELFDQYTSLRSVLDLVEQFVSDHPIIDDRPGFDEEVEHLVSCLQSWGEDRNFFEMNYDLLSFVMPDFFTSNIFSELPCECKKDHFERFSTLRNLLNYLDRFVPDHPKKETRQILVNADNRIIR